MNIRSSIASQGLSRFLSLLHRTLLMSFLTSLIWLPGLFLTPALAMPNVTSSEEVTSQAAGSNTAGDARMLAFIDCLPKQLSKPNFNRSMGEMGNDQLERILFLKSNPKLSQAEVELKSCLNSKGFTSPANLVSTN
jgi:hypothetical protein